ncbi:hypothetical protein [Pseudomonas protegens]|uniref:hypothetical protein n=1 Tax=Pseudomonas protegens TaxID=380021 RepID=UPI001E4A9AC3|nr:hypothetical protein [Pseudomonas protegens]MCD9569480.1 hypothetical protein [Pseudomonas protegens]
MKTNYFNAHTQALGALALIPLYLTSPGTVSKATLIGTANEATLALTSMPACAVELAEVYRCVSSVIQPGQIAYVTPTNVPETPYGAVVADERGLICAAARGASKEGLAELIRLKLQPADVGAGEAST